MSINDQDYTLGIKYQALKDTMKPHNYSSTNNSTVDLFILHTCIKLSEIDVVLKELLRRTENL